MSFMIHPSDNKTDVTHGRRFDPEKSTTRRCAVFLLQKNLMPTKSNLVFPFEHSPSLAVR
jgi:hypothetical protein